MNKVMVLISALVLCGCCGDLGSGKHISKPALVIEVGECYGGVGFFWRA